MATITPQFSIKIKTLRGKIFSVPAISKIEVKTTRDADPDTASIELASMKGLSWETFKRGDEVEISFGHKEADDPLSPVFLGTIAKVGPRMPVCLTCQDYLANFKRCWHKTRSKSIAVDGEQSLNSIMADMLKNADQSDSLIKGMRLVTSPDFDQIKWRGKLAIGNRAYREVIDDLLKLGWDLFILPGTKTLYFGPRSNIDILVKQEKTPIFKSGLNIISPEIDYNDLSNVRWVEVRVSDETKKAEMPDGWFPKSVQFYGDSANVGQFKGWGDNYSGDKDGEIVKQDIAGIKKTDADYYAQLFYAINSKKGISGSFKTFGLGYFKHWMKCRLEVGFDTFKHTGHHFPSGIDYSYSPDDGYKMTVSFENSRDGER